VVYAKWGNCSIGWRKKPALC